jgi:hypothetical protein
MKSELELDQGSVYGQTYYTVRPKSVYFREGYSNIDWNNMQDWCVKTFGETSEKGVWVPDQRWYANNARLWFREEDDRAMFVLRWS